MAMQWPLVRSKRQRFCTDCHGAHEILDAKDSKSPIFKFNVPLTCGKCHDTISKEFQQKHSRKAVAQGNWQAHAATDCRRIHSIKAHTDPNSRRTATKHRAGDLRALSRRCSALAGIRHRRTPNIHLSC